MAGEDEKISWVLDLDNTQFARAITDSKQQVGSLVDTLGDVAKVAGVIGSAYLAVKHALDMTFEAETIRQVNNQFDKLSENAGIAGNALKKALNDAAGGLIDDDELIQMANRSIIEMGQSAEKLPQIMDLARKATSVFGGELSQNFEAINHAIATGQTRALKNLGLMVDSDKAAKKYAESLGIAANELSTAGRQQAIMNAVLEKGSKDFKDTDVNAKEATNTYQQLRVTIGQIGEAITVAFEKIAGPTVRMVLRDLSSAASATTNYLKSVLGDGSEQAESKVSLLKGQIGNLEKELDRMSQKQESQPWWKSIFTLAPENSSEAIKTRLGELREELKKAEEIHNKFAAEADAQDAKNKAKGADATPGTTDNGMVDLEKRKENERAFQRDMLSMRQEALNNKIQLEQTAAQVETDMALQKQLIEDQHRLKILEIQESDKLTADMKRQELVMAEQTKADQLAMIDEQLQQRKAAALENYERHATGTADGIARAFEAGGQRQMLVMNSFQAQGQRVFQSFQNNAVGALTAWGAGQKTASEAAKGFIFSVLADEAIARGTIMMMASIFPPNPVGLAAGAGLIAFGGFLRSQAAGSSKMSGGGVSMSGGGTGSTGTDRSSSMAQQDDLRAGAQPRDNKSVNIQIQGNYIETDQTRVRMAELVREALDANDFRVN